MKTVISSRPFNSGFAGALKLNGRFVVWALVLITVKNAPAQVSLSGTSYQQNFNNLGSGLPAGWTVRTNASATRLGTAATFNAAKVSWGTATGQFANYASTFDDGTNVLGTATTAEQGGITNRCPGIRQTLTFGNPGAAFVLQVQNTVGFSNLVFSVDLNLLSVQGYSTTWTIDYAVTNGPPTNFTVLGTYPDPGTFGSNTVSYALDAVADNQSQNLWLRVIALSAATGSGSRDTFGIDNFVLNYEGPAAATITLQPTDRTNLPRSTATFVTAASGTPPLYYQWYKGSVALTDGDAISGATGDTLTINPVFHADAGDYQVIVTNVSNSATSKVAVLTVNGFIMTAVSPTNTLAGVPVSVEVNFIENQSPINSATGVSSNQSVLPDSNISATTTGNAATATMTPAAGANGVALVSISATEGNFTTNSVFPLLVVPGSDVVFNDHFDYANGAVTSSSYGLWRNHSGPPDEASVTNGELRVSRSFDEDVNALLMGQPYETNSAAVLYSRFQVRFTTLPTVNGNYFAIFKGPASTDFRARVWTSIANVANTNQYRLGIGNANTSTAATAQFPQDLELGTNYTVITKLVVANGLSTLWINPTSENDPSITAGDAVTNNFNITAYAFRQTGSEGIMFVDNLVIATTFAAALGAPTPIPLNIQPVGTDVTLTWTNAAFSLQAAPTMIGTYTNIPGATSPYTTPISDDQRCFRLAYP